MEFIKSLDTYDISDSNEIYDLKGQITVLRSGKRNINFEVSKDEEVLAKIYINPESSTEDNAIKSVNILYYADTTEADEFIFNSIINVEKQTIEQ